MEFVAKGHWRHRGHDIVRGSYVGTPDDRADRWYIEVRGASLADRRGPGIRTLGEAQEEVNGRIAEWARARLAMMSTDELVEFAEWALEELYGQSPVKVAEILGIEL